MRRGSEFIQRGGPLYTFTTIVVHVFRRPNCRVANVGVIWLLIFQQCTTAIRTTVINLSLEMAI